MAFEYIGALLEEAVQSTASVEVRGRVEQVVGTIIRAVVPGVKVGELCILRNPWEDWTLRAEVVGFVKQVALLTPLGDLQGRVHGHGGGGIFPGSAQERSAHDGLGDPFRARTARDRPCRGRTPDPARFPSVRVFDASQADGTGGQFG